MSHEKWKEKMEITYEEYFRPSYCARAFQV